MATGKLNETPRVNKATENDFNSLCTTFGMGKPSLIVFHSLPHAQLTNGKGRSVKYINTMKYPTYPSDNRYTYPFASMYISLSVYGL